MTDPVELARRRLLGWGLRCDPLFPGVDLGRDVGLRAGPNGVELDTLEGADCLGQDLSLALTTLLGSDVFNATFGFDGLAALTENLSPLLAQERIRVAVVSVLGRDPRVRRIVDIKFVDARLDAPVAGARELDVRVSFETLTDDRVTLDLGRPAGSD